VGDHVQFHFKKVTLLVFHSRRRDRRTPCAKRRQEVHHPTHWPLTKNNPAISLSGNASPPLSPWSQLTRQEHRGAALARRSGGGHEARDQRSARVINTTHKGARDRSALRHPRCAWTVLPVAGGIEGALLSEAGGFAEEAKSIPG